MVLIDSILILAPLWLTKVSAQTVAQLIQARPTLSRAWALNANHPEWSGAGPVTVFLPNDAALAAGNVPAGSLRSLTVNRAMDFLTTANYQILEDVAGVTRFVYDNYRGGQAIPEIHCRFGTGEALTVENLRASNGWLYVLNAAIEPPLNISANLQRTGFTQFLAFIDRAGMRAELDAMSGSTVFAFTNTASGIAQLNTMTPAQLRTVILNHISPAIYYSTGLDPSVPLPSSNTGQSFRIGVGPDLVTINGARIILADVISSVGVIHHIEQVFIPSNIPSSTAVLPATSAVVPSASATPTKEPMIAQNGPITNPGNRNTQNINNASGKLAPFIYFGVALLSALYFIL